MQIPGPLDTAGLSRPCISHKPHPSSAQGSADLATRTTVVTVCLRSSATEGGEDGTRSWSD